MAIPGPAGSAAASEWGEGRERGARRRKVYGYLKAANEMRQSYQSQWTQSRNQGDEYGEGTPGNLPDAEIVRNGEEEMILFPSYARRHIKKTKTAPHDMPGAEEDIAHPEVSGDAEYWKKRWEEYEDDNAIVDIDVRGWIYTPHKGPMTRKNRILVAVARRLSGIPAPETSPDNSRDSSRHSVRTDRTDEDIRAAQEAQSIVHRGEAEAAAAWRGSYSENASRGRRKDSPSSTRSNSPESHHNPLEGAIRRRLRHTGTDSTLTSDSDDPTSEAIVRRNTNSSQRSANMSREELARANAALMTRLRPFMHLPLVDASITVFFFNDDKSQSRSINTNDSGHFLLRASLDFVPHSIRVLASEDLSATEKVLITDPRGVSLISDIDDTIKHSAISAGAREIFTNTFIRDLSDLTVKGVKEWYSKLATMGVQLHYVSNSPWQLYPLLRSYFTLAGLPPGSFHLKQYSGMLQGIFEPAAERKRGSLDKIAQDFPERQFILVGDSGEADLEVYTEFVMANPGRVLGIFIRDVTTPLKKDFFDQSRRESPDKGHSQGPDPGPERSDAPEERPRLPKRRQESSYQPEIKTSPVEDLIDLSDDIGDRREDSPQVPRESQELGQNNRRAPSKTTPPNRPSKPPALRSTSTSNFQSTNHDRSISTSTNANNDSSSSNSTQKTAPPPPAPRRSATSNSISPTQQRAPFSSQRQHQSSQQSPNPSSENNSMGHPRQGEPDGYTTAARRQLVSAYNTIPSARTLWSGSPHAAASNSGSPTQEHLRSTPAVPPASSRRNLTAAAASLAGNRLSWATGGTTDSTGTDPATAADGSTYYNKKEETWKRRWVRAEEIMRREGVVLKMWREGGDAMNECVALCEKALEEGRQEAQEAERKARP